MKTRTRSLIILAASTALAATYAPTTTAGAAAVKSGKQGPEVHLTSAVAGDSLAPGAATPPSAGAPGVGGEGSGFAINVEAQTHDSTGIAVKEGLNIRNTAIIGSANPNFPGLEVTVDSDLTTPDGTKTIKAGTNLAALFNVAGTDDTPGRGVTVWAGWHVLESLAPSVTSLTVTASVTDTAGRTGTDSVTYVVDPTATTGQALTPEPSAGVPASIAGVAGPVLDFAAPEHPSKVAVGTHPSDGLESLVNGSLFFIQLDALDVARHGLAVDENGGGPTAAIGPIASPASISTTPGGGGANPNVPGLDFSFDVALQQPNGHIIDAGENLGALFNVAGSAIGPQGAIRTTLDWVVGGKLLIPADQDTVLMTARVTDSKGGSTVTTRRVGLSKIASGQALTPQP